MMHSDTTGELSLDSLISQIRSTEKAGDYLSAYDLASRGIAAFPDEESLKNLAVRALARAGSPQRAGALYREFGLSGSKDVDVASLEARIAKDLFLLHPRDRSLARNSAQLYEGVFQRTGDSFPGINAATMWALAGDRPRSEEIARQVLQICDQSIPSTAEDRYWLHATQAEGRLLLGEHERTIAHLKSAAAEVAGNHDAAASTAKQLRLICREQGIDETFLEILPRPRVIVYSGHMIAAPDGNGRFPATLEESVATRIREALERRNVGIGFGSLASGADILFAEALLDRGAELHVVLPFNTEEFREISVAPAKGIWLERFDKCLGRASSVIYATRGAYLGHDVLFGFTAEIAMGLARIRARALESTPQMIAVWDGREGHGEAGTAIDIARWRRTDADVEIIPVEADGAAPQPNTSKPQKSTGIPARRILPVLFGDIKGFSNLEEQHLPAYSAGVLTRLAGAIHAFGDKILFTNTWGDAVHVVFADVATAARCALRLHEALNAIDFAALGLPEEISMRISLHVGPVFTGHDPINREPTFFGRTLTRAARMEPVTPAGEVYVTERFAALVAMARECRVQCSYVGNVPLAKDFGTLRMYRLLPLAE